MKDNILFKPLEFSDISLMHRWFNLPHVQAFYSLRTWTEKEVQEKLAPYILREKPVSGFIIFLNHKPIGYLQYYAVSDYPWPNQGLTQHIIQNAAGMDLFIGELSAIGSGMGQAVISAFLHNYIWPKFEYCIVDPDIENQPAIRCYRKLNFVEHQLIDTTDAINRPTQLQLMILKREK